MESVLSMLTELGAELLREFLYILPYLAFGVFLEAIIRTLKWHVKIRTALTRYGMLAIPLAALLGVASPLCACATLPLVISLLVGGLPLAPAMALLVTSPLMSPASFTMLSGMLGGEWAVTVAVCAVTLGLFAGYVTHFLGRYGFSTEVVFRQELPKGNFHDPAYPVEELRCDCGQQLSHRVDRCTHNKFLVFGARFWEGSLKIGKFVLIGLVIEVVAMKFIPNGWITGLLEGEGIAPIFTLTLAAIPLHLPQVTAASMLYGFYLPDPGQTIPLAVGPGIAMLVGGPVTALPVMAVFISMFKPRVLALYITLCVGGTISLALLWRLVSPLV
ncbi:MAG: permease [Desulfuromonadaceae bacterium]|nr:permease [Desulfuromonadaceae bacterium]